MNAWYLRLTLNNYVFRAGIILINNNNKKPGIRKPCLNIKYFGGHRDTGKEKIDSEQQQKKKKISREPE